MSAPDERSARLEHLLDRYLDGGLEGEEKAELEQLLLSSPAARERFWEHASFDALLRRLHEERWGAEREAPRPARRGGRWAIAAGGMAALAAAAFVLLPREVPPPVESASSGVAVLARALDVEWEPGGKPHRIGAVLSPGPLRIARGLVQLDFYSGAQLVLQGPAELEVVSAGEVICRRGKLRGHVPPPAVGFKVRSANMDLVDLGTSFGLDVSPSGAGEVHVFDGKVQVSPGGRDPRELPGGQGIAFGGAGSRPIASSPQAFPAVGDLERMELENGRRRLDRWSAAMAALGGARGPLVHFTFQPETLTTRAVTNQGTLGAATGSGTLIGGSPSSGRWPGKGGLDFRRVSDRVRLAVPGAFASLSMVAWVRVDSLPNAFHGLLMTDGFEIGYPHWQIRGSGVVSFSVRDDPEKPYLQTLTPPAILPEMFGQWVQLAVVYDGPGATVTQYVNGRKVVSEPIPRPVQIRLDASQLGNWSLLKSSASGSAIRNLVGAIDEFLLYDRPLADSEIAEMFAMGDPYRPFETGAR